MRVAVFGTGAVGGRLPTLLARAGHEPLAALPIPTRGDTAELRVPNCDVGIIALPSGMHGDVARALLRQGADVISVSDASQDVRSLLNLHEEAIERRRRVVVGAGFAPGLSCALAMLAARHMDILTEVHVAKHGTGGPACARQHHAALKRPARDYRYGGWFRRPGGSGRELVWFPEPIGGADCYRADLPDPLLLAPELDSVERVSARVAATRRDRFTYRLPMLRPPHAEGLIGAVRVEAWGRIGHAPVVRAYGVSAAPAMAAAIVAGATVGVVDAATGYGAAGLAHWFDADAGPAAFLTEIVEAGLRVETFEGQRNSD